MFGIVVTRLQDIVFSVLLRLSIIEACCVPVLPDYSRGTENKVVAEPKTANLRISDSRRTWDDMVVSCAWVYRFG
jgi:hypothetical protein